MELTRSLVETRAEEYRETEPLYTVEQEHVEMLHDTFASGEFGWRDVEWVVQWYFRRYLGAYPDEKRREIENSVRDNDFDDVIDTLSAVADVGESEGKQTENAETRSRLELLTTLEGVDVPIASAFLLFVFPDRYVVVGEREWRVLSETGELAESYPEPPSVEEYLRYDAVCRGLTERFGVDAWTLYRALWRLWKEEFGDEEFGDEKFGEEE